MTSFIFDNSIPAAPNNPSSDQPIMLTNNISNQSIWNVDHVGFNTSGSGGAGSSGGQHLQVAFNSKNTPGAQTDPISTLYTASGTASTNADVKFRNASGTFPISLIRAWGAYVGVSPPVQSSNVVSVVVGVNLYTITLTSGATTGTDFAVLFLPGSTPLGIVPFYTITGANTFTVSNTTGITSFSFVVLQL